MTDTTYLLLYSANLIFIVTHLYGWLLKWFYRPEAYREHFHELFPAQRSVGIIYLLQLFELSYLLQIGDSDALSLRPGPPHTGSVSARLVYAHRQRL